jgi:hypothetical protein
MAGKTHILILAAILVFGPVLKAQVPSDKTANPSGDDSNVRPPVTKADVKIVQRAREILSSPSKWNRADTRVCPPEAKTFSLYCALEKATNEVSGNFKHRGAAMQEARFVIDEIAPKAKNYDHRLMGYNNDATTTVADIHKVFELLEERVAKRLTEESEGSKK